MSHDKEGEVLRSICYSPPPPQLSKNEKRIYVNIYILIQRYFTQQQSQWQSYMSAFASYGFTEGFHKI